MKFRKPVRTLCLLLVFCLLAGSAAAMTRALATEIPVKVELKSGAAVSSNAKAVVDSSNLAEGLVMVKYVGGRDVRIKLQITKSGGTTYTYDLNNKGVFETFPLVEGDGSYSIKVYENTTGTKYALAHSATVTLALRNEFLPFLYANQYVNFTADSAVTAQAVELCTGQETSLLKVTAVYDYVVGNFTYDLERAKSVQSGYLPDVDAVLAEKKGICFDYASVMTAMLRSQNIPCKLVVGYAGTVYHAWISVYLEESGWVEKAIYFDGHTWKLMDPTFASSANSSKEILAYISNGDNYTQKYVY